MAFVFQLIGVLGIILSVLAGFVIGSGSGPYGLAAALTYSTGGILSSLLMLAIGGILSRLDSIVRNTANVPAVQAERVPAPAPSFKWKAKD